MSSVRTRGVEVALSVALIVATAYGYNRGGVVGATLAYVFTAWLGVAVAGYVVITAHEHESFVENPTHRRLIAIGVCVLWPILLVVIAAISASEKFDG